MFCRKFLAAVQSKTKREYSLNVLHMEDADLHCAEGVMSFSPKCCLQFLTHCSRQWLLHSQLFLLTLLYNFFFTQWVTEKCASTLDPALFWRNEYSELAFCALSIYSSNNKGILHPGCGSPTTLHVSILDTKYPFNILISQPINAKRAQRGGVKIRPKNSLNHKLHRC